MKQANLKSIFDRDKQAVHLRVLVVAIMACALIGVLGDEAIAAQCQTIDHQEICLVSIKRSAKYHWQYRVQVKIDGKRQPSEKFDCRDLSTKVGDARPPLQKQTRDFVCHLIPKR